MSGTLLSSVRFVCVTLRAEFNLLNTKKTDSDSRGKLSTIKKLHLWEQFSQS